MQGTRIAARSGPPSVGPGQPPRPKPPKIVIPRMDLLAGDGNVRAVLDVRINTDLLIRECQLLFDPHDHLFYVSPPQRQYEKAGQRRFRPLCHWPKHFHAAIREAAVAAYADRARAAGQIGGLA